MVELNFITSSRIKLEHARHLCRKFDVTIRRQRNYGKGYEEPRIFERKELLTQSLEDALTRWRKNVSKADEKFIFIEDTSVIISALSNADKEVPGVDIKFWMQEYDFAAVDSLLKANGNDRRVIVRSDVLLALTKELANELGKKYIHFTSQSYGTITDREFKIETNPVFPWLDDKTFNKWFVPDGHSKPISLLPIHSADQHDFRAGAFRDMLSFLEQHKVIQIREIAQRFSHRPQHNLPIGVPLYIVCGPTCAGKTTLAEHMVKEFGFYHIEASDFMYLSYFRKLGFNSGINIAKFAKQALIENPSIVADLILEHIQKLGMAHIVISGFRALEEILHFERYYAGMYNCDVLTIDAPYEVRLNRYLVRNREEHSTVAQFKADSNVQNEIGLEEIISTFDDKKITNDGSFKRFYDRFDKCNKISLANLAPLPTIVPKDIHPSALEDAILISLFVSDGAFYGTAEIAKLINETFSSEQPKNKNNVSRYFNQHFHPYFEVMEIGGVNKFRLSQTGKMHAQWVAISKNEIAGSRCKNRP